VGDQKTEVRCTSDITVRLVQQVGGDYSVIAAAKVSVSGEEALAFSDPGRAEDNYGLIRYLMRMKHGSCFEHGSMTFFVHAPILVWREWHRHRVQSFNEQSGRYSVLEPVFYVPPRDRPMLKVDDWKPGRPKFLTIDERYPPGMTRPSYGDSVYRVLCDNLRESYELAYRKYEENLALGIDPGLARDCLPVGVYSSCWVTCNPRSMMAFLSLRTHEPGANHPSYPLYEIEAAARKCEGPFAEHWPLTYRAFCECGREAP
jgi:thymidylate synthase (FAD)